MPRQSQPWRRKDVAGGPWYAWVNKERVWLAPGDATKGQAREELLKLLAASGRAAKARERDGPTFREVVNLFLDHATAAVARDELAALTLEGYRRFLLPAAVNFGRHPVAALKPYHVQEWLDAPGKVWGATTRHNAITAVKAALNWARKQGRIPSNPVGDMSKPTPKVTEGDFTAEQARAAMEAARDRPFRDLLSVLWGTGARPSEVYRITGADLDVKARLVVLKGKTTRRTQRDRVIYLGARAAAVLTRLAGEIPAGPLLRNEDGQPWTRNSVAIRFRRLRREMGALGEGVSAKSYRHGWATDALEGEVPIATVAALLGHVGTKMVERHYSKLRKRKTHLADAARKVRPGEK